MRELGDYRPSAQRAARGSEEEEESPEARKWFKAKLSRSSSSEGVNDHFLKTQGQGGFNDDALATLGKK